MPAMGDSVAEGTVLEWHKQEGDSVQADETLVEISTDKVDAEVPSPAAGRVVKIHAAEGDTVAVGALLAEISTNGDGAENGSEVPATGVGVTPVSGESPPATAAEAVASATTEAEGVAAAQASTGELIDIVTPTGGESVTEGTILEWASRSATSSSTATPWSRSRPTRSTWSFPPPPPGRSPRSWRRTERRSASGR